MKDESKTMRDIFISRIYKKMFENRDLFFLCADFGSPALDKLSKRFKERFINVGIAEQNLINVATGLALEGFTAYVYGIAPFLTMRPYEQSRNNLSLLSQLKKININLIGVGAGLSYDLSGPTHHCLEDIILMRALPNFMILSPSDSMLAERCADFSIAVNKPKYIRFDAKGLPPIYHRINKKDFQKGFKELAKSKEVCLVTTGYMTHIALRAREKLVKDGIGCGVLDVFILKPLNEDGIYDVLKRYKHVVTIEEGFIGKGGLDTAISNVLTDRRSCIDLKRMGFKDRYVFELGGRDCLHKLNHLDDLAIIKVVKGCL